MVTVTMAKQGVHSFRQQKQRKWISQTQQSII